MGEKHPEGPRGAPAVRRRSALQVGWGPSRLRHPVTAAAVATVVGVAATAAGAGVGIRYLQKTGLSLETVTGLALLVIGLVLLGYAGTVAWKALHGWWRLVLLPAVLAAALLPQVLLDALAVRDRDRRARLRTSNRAARVPLLAALAIALGASVALLSGESHAVVAAALCATAGLGIAAAPVTVTTSRPSEQRSSRRSLEQPGSAADS